MSDREFSDVRWEFFVVGSVIIGDGEFGEQGEGGATGAFRADIVAAEEAVARNFGFEFEVQQGLDGRPGGLGGGNGINERIVSRYEDGLGRDVVLEMENGQVVIGVVVIRTGFASETHAGERAELGFDGGLDGAMEVDEVLGDGNSGHLEGLEDNSLAVLRLVETGVVVGNVVGWSHEFLAPGGEFVGGMPGMDVDVSGAIGVINEALVFLDGSEDEDKGVVHEG